MSIRSRMTAVALAVGAIASLGLMAPTAATAATPVAAEYKIINVHIRATSGSNGDVGRCLSQNAFGTARTSCSMAGYYDPGHTAGWNGVQGTVQYRSGGGDDRTDVTFETNSGARLVGRIANRSSDRFVVRELTAPGYGPLSTGLPVDVNAQPGTPGGPLLFIVENPEANQVTNRYTYDFYARGFVPVESSTSGTNPLAGLFGSS